MTERAVMKPCELPGTATVVDGVVILDGPDGVAVTMTNKTKRARGGQNGRS